MHHQAQAKQTRFSPLSGLPGHQSGSFQNGKQQKGNLPKNLNIISKSGNSSSAMGGIGLSKTFKHSQGNRQGSQHSVEQAASAMAGGAT